MSTAPIRNVVLLGPAGSGKTTVVAALAAYPVIPAAVPAPDPRAYASTALTHTALVHDGVKLNLMDTPGHPDFAGHVRAGLRAADAAVFVVSATAGLDAPTILLWEECAALDLPRAVLVTGLDEPGADFDEAVAIAQRVFGEGVVPVHVPLLDDGGTVAGLYELLAERIVDHSGGTRSVRPPDDEHVDATVELRGALLEAVIGEAEDETLLDRYLEGEPIGLPTLVAELARATARGALHPVLAVAPRRGVGVLEVLDLIVTSFPSPLARPVPPLRSPTGEPHELLAGSAAEPLVAEVLTTVDEPDGRTALLRVFSGTLRPGSAVSVSGHRTESVTALVGGDSGASAGDVVRVTGLEFARVGDTLSDPADPVLLEPGERPEPGLSVLVTPREPREQGALAAALARLVADDPSLRLEVGTGPPVLWCLGPAQLEVVLERLSTRYRLAVDASPARLDLRETFTGPGAGWAEDPSGQVRVELAVEPVEPLVSVERVERVEPVEPVEPGNGVEFEVASEVGPPAVLAAIERGVRAALAAGLRAGYPVHGVRVTLVRAAVPPGCANSVVEDVAALALQDAASTGSVVVLEPVDLVAVTVPDEYVAAVRSELSGRRGRVLGAQAAAGGRTVVRAEVPGAALAGYALALRSLTHGSATFTRAFVRYEPVSAAPRP